MEHTIKKLSANELDLAWPLIHQLHIEDQEVNPALPAESYLRSLLSSATFHVFVALVNDQVVGGLTAYELPMFTKKVNEMFLYDIVVLESYRQQGIAYDLIAALKILCKEKNISIIFVGTSTDNEPAKKLYRATGGEMEEIPWFTYRLK